MANLDNILLDFSYNLSIFDINIDKSKAKYTVLL